MRQLIRQMIVLCFSMSFALVGHGQPFDTHPRTQEDGQPWRLGYVESGIFSEYPLTLRAIMTGLVELGWLQFSQPIPDDLSAEALWKWADKHDEYNYLSFVEDAYWRPGNFESSLRAPTREAIKKRLEQSDDLDLLIAMGTWAGQDMRAIGPPIPTIVASTSDPLSAGIIDSIEDSGVNNLHARIEPERYERQVRLFHDIVPFKTLGIVYEDTEEGRTYTALDAILEVSKERHFEVSHCHASMTNLASEEVIQGAIDCFQKLADKHVDAVYVTTHRGVTKTSIVKIAEILRQAGIPSFSMLGAEDVKQGILLSLANANVNFVGLFHAEAIAKVFNGALPREITQIWVDPAKIALNLETAKIIGFDPPIDILLAADDVYDNYASK